MKDASDIYLTTGAPPSAKIDGTIRPIEKASIPAGRVKEIAYEIMDEDQADFTLTFYHLSRLNAKPGDRESDIRELFKKTDAIGAWLARWRQRLSSETMDDSERQQAMQTVNPVYIPRNHQVEAVIRAAEDHDDFDPFHALHAVLQEPFQYQQGKESYMLPPEPEEVVQQTFCGT